MNAGGTCAVSQTPLDARKKSWPPDCIPAASTSKMTGSPRRAPTIAAVSVSADRWTCVLFPGRRLEAPFSWRVDDPAHDVCVQVASVPGGRGEQRADADPAAFLTRQSDGTRIMAQDVRQELAVSGEVVGNHAGTLLALG